MMEKILEKPDKKNQGRGGRSERRMTRKEKKELRARISKKYSVKKVEIFKANNLTDNLVYAINEEGRKVCLGYVRNL